jgi:uncharacterized protein
MRGSPLRRVLDVWGIGVPPPAAAHDVIALRTRDGVDLVADLLHGPARPTPGSADRAPSGRGPAVVLLHGFAAHRRKPAYGRLAARLARDAAVLVPDLRGHGASAGRSALGDREVHDVRAAAAHLRRAGYGPVALVGASMGATAALRAAGQTPGIADAVVAISAPSAFVRSGGVPAVAVLARMVTSPAWRAVLSAALRVRVVPAWSDPAPSVHLVGAITPTPLLLVHGDDDGWFGVDHLDALEAAAGAPTAVWREPAGFGHAEDGFSPRFCDRLAEALAAVRADGRFPAAPPRS